MKKATIATVKSFVRKNNNNLLVEFKSSFDGMTDGLVYSNDGFQKAKTTDNHVKHTLGISGAWFVGRSRDYIQPIETKEIFGYKISNSCGSFTIAIQK